MNLTCIYHANCSDGMAAAWVVSLMAAKKKIKVDFIPCTYQSEIPDVTGLDVVIVDFSFKRDVMEEMLDKANSITVIDHHKTAKAELLPLLESGKLNGIFNMDKSGAMLTWEWYFQDKTPPKLIEHIQDRDLWRFDLEGTREICAAVYSYPMEIEVWDGLMFKSIEDLRKEGEAIDRAHLKNVNGLVEYLSRRCVLAGYDVPILNCNYMFASDAGHALAIGEAFSVTYFDSVNGCKFSLRSTSESGSVDVSEIAAKFGGGGHKHAAGFKLDYEELHLLDSVE